MANIGYTLDEVGTLPANKITETRVLSSKVIDNRTFMIPKVTPFFGDNFTVVSGGQTLVRGVDYDFILNSPELSSRLDRDIYAGIIFNKLTTTQVVTITYQTIGGDFNLPLDHTVESLSRLIKNPTFTTFSEITGTPAGLPTYDHIQDWSSMAGFDDFLKQLELIYLALLSTNEANQSNGGSTTDAGTFLNALQQHIISKSAHTKDQVGLSNVDNFATANYVDFNGPSYPNNLFVTPSLVMYAINTVTDQVFKSLNDTVNKLQTQATGQTKDWQTLQATWVTLQSSLTAVNQNYTQMQQAVHNYQIQVENMNQSYQNVSQNQLTWQNAVNNYAQQLQQYSTTYNQIVASNTDVGTKLQKLTDAYNIVSQSMGDYVKQINSIAQNINTLQQNTIYLTSKIFTAGTHKFIIRASETFSFTLIGGGGGLGNYNSTTGTSPISGQHGQPTRLWCMQSLKDGSANPDNTPIAVAGGGWAAQGTVGGLNGSAYVYGGVGQGGYVYLNPSLKASENIAGKSGVVGSGNYDTTLLATPSTGYSIYNKGWGAGASGPQALSQGGDGAKLSFSYQNTTNTDLEFVLTVGGFGESVDPTFNNAKPGLAVITKN